MLSTSVLTSAANIGAAAMWLTFMSFYIGYGNRFRSWAARSLMIMAFGYIGLVVPLLVHHPFGLSTATSKLAAWVQIIGVGLSIAAPGSLLALMIKANGRWPWQREPPQDDGSAP